MKKNICFDEHGNIVFDNNGIAKIIFNRIEIEAIRMIIEKIHFDK